jgi:hypothetical protein
MYNVDLKDPRRQKVIPHALPVFVPPKKDGFYVEDVRKWISEYSKILAANDKDLELPRKTESKKRMRLF